MKTKFVIVMACFMAFGLQGQQAHKELLKGSQAHKDGKLDKAETHFRAASKKDPTGTYNLGVTLQEQERLEEALNQYDKLIQGSGDQVLKSNALFNKGHVQYSLGDYGESLNSYKELLMDNPSDPEVLNNLWKAWQQIQQNQPPPQQQKNEQEERENQDENEEQQEQEQQRAESDSDEQRQNPQPQESKEQPLEEQDAEQLLKIAEQEDQKVQDKLKKSRKGEDKPKKNW